MFALKNISRFPQYFNPRPQGAQCFDLEFAAYVNSITDRTHTIIIRRFVQHQFVRRICVGARTLNNELVITKQFVYPAQKPEFLPTDAYCLGFKIKTQRQYFIPVTLLKILTQKELDILQKVATIEMLDRPKTVALIEKLGIRIIDEYRLANGTYTLILNNGQQFGINMQENGMFNATNVCFTPDTELHVLEVLLLFQQYGHLVVYPSHGYDWIV